MAKRKRDPVNDAIVAHYRAIAFPPRDRSDGPGPPPGNPTFDYVGRILGRQLADPTYPALYYTRLFGLTADQERRFRAAGLRVWGDE